MEFTDKVVIITGASSGIGAACAIHFAKLSAKLSLVGRNLNNLTKIANQCLKLNGIPPKTIIADISKEDDAKKIIDETIRHFGKIDVLINNAGVFPMAKIQGGIETYDHVMSVNLRGTVFLTDLAIPRLIETKGNIVNVSSVLAKKPLPATPAYCMSKAALDMFTQCAALELGPKGVRVNSVNPGPVKTNLFLSAGVTKEGMEKFFEMFEKLCPLRRLTLAEDVAEIIVFLASQKAKCITGCCHVIDSGMSISDNQNAEI